MDEKHPRVSPSDGCGAIIPLDGHDTPLVLIGNARGVVSLGYLLPGVTSRAIQNHSRSLMKSRKTALPVSMSPTRRHSIPSMSSASRKAESRSTRSRMVSLKSRVKAIFRTFLHRLTDAKLSP